MKYRVDIHWCLKVPKETTNSKYVGDNLNLALDIFDDLNPGVDEFGNSNKQYGVIISYWNGISYEPYRYKTKRL